MKTPEEIRDRARRLVESLETDELVALYDKTTAAHIKALGDTKKYAEITIIRGWITDELERRDPQACAEWLESNDESPAQYYNRR